MVQRGGPRLALQPQSRWSWLQPLPPSVPTICCIKSFGPSSCLPFLCPSPQIFQVRAPRKPRANTRAGPRTQERRAESGTQQGAASGGRCRAYCAEGTGHARCVCPHLHTRVHTHAALTHKHVCTCRWATPCTHKHTHTRADTNAGHMPVGTHAEVCIHTHAHMWTHTQRHESTYAHAPLRCAHAHTHTGEGPKWWERERLGTQSPHQMAGGTPHAPHGGQGVEEGAA